MAEYLTRQGDTLSQVCWRHYGRSAGVVEAVLAANAGLAGRGPILPAGVTITLPEIETPTPEDVIRLWG